MDKKNESLRGFCEITPRQGSILSVQARMAHESGPTSGVFASGHGTVLAWQMLNTYCAVILGDFRNEYPQCHSIADMADIIGGLILREVTGVLFLVVYVICTASGIIGVSVALNTLSSHALCTNWFVFIATLMVAFPAAIRKFEKIAWLT
ncbi:hypothetical protein ACKAV7_005607 [Fusarium commune]